MYFRSCAIFAAACSAAHAQPVVVDPDFTLIDSIPFDSPRGIHISAFDGNIYVGRSDTSSDGLYVLDAIGVATRLTTGDRVSGVVVDPVDGDVFFSEAFGGGVYRYEIGAAARETWVSGFASGDDDPCGMAIAPLTYTGTVLSPGEALVVDRGFSGPDGIWLWSPDTSENETLIVDNSSVLVDAIDVAITDTTVYVCDRNGSSDGVLYQLDAGATLTAIATSQPIADPWSIAVDPISGDLLVLDKQLGRIVRVDPATGLTTDVATGLGTTIDPYASLEVSPDGRQIVVADTANDQIHIIARCGGSLDPGDDCNSNGVWDGCDIALGNATDCNANRLPDSCDLLAGTSTDCNSDGIPDECAICPPVDVVVIMDTSSSMDDEASALCAGIVQVIDGLNSRGLQVNAVLLGISETPGGAYSCLTDNVINLLGNAVPGSPPPEIAVLGDCPGGNEIASEDWGRATAVVAGLYPWTPGAVRIVIPIADEGPWCGDPSTANDETSILHAITVARDNAVVVSPIMGSGADQQIIDYAEVLAGGTSGESFLSSESSEDLIDIFEEVILDACSAINDCNDNGRPDSCDIADGDSLDANGDGIPDECQVDPDCNGNGQLDVFDIYYGLAPDCNSNWIPDACDVTFNVSEDCDGNGIPDECPACPEVEVVFVMDTSSSMNDEAAALCADINGVVSALALQGVNVTPEILGISATPGGAYDCLTDHVINLYGTVVPGNPPSHIDTLGACPGGNQVASEDWALAVAVVAGQRAWAPGSIRLIVPLSDEGPWCGDPVTTTDEDAIDHAGLVALANGVIVSPVTGSGAGSAVIQLAQEIALATGGTQFSSSNAATDLTSGILQVVTDACFSVSDCNGNGRPDSCDIADGDSPDIDSDGKPDECEELCDVCPADWNSDGIVNTSDFLAYLNDYNTVVNGGLPINCDPDLAVPFGVMNTSDFVAFLNAFVAGCP